MRAALVTMLLLLWAMPAAAQDLFLPPEAQSDDPYVQLDAAKLMLNDGKLARARDLIHSIDARRSEDFVQQEVAFQMLLVDYAYLSAVHHLLLQVNSAGLYDSPYGEWLQGQWVEYAVGFHESGTQWLSMTEGGQALEFVRFRLPRISEEHIHDLAILADPAVLNAAATNWDDGREGLGEALVTSQARAALVLASAEHYDMPESRRTIDGVARRLEAGVPVRETAVLDWLARSSEMLASGNRPLLELAEDANRRLVSRVSGNGSNEMLRDAQKRLSGLDEKLADSTDEGRSELPDTNENNGGEEASE